MKKTLSLILACCAAAGAVSAAGAATIDERLAELTAKYEGRATGLAAISDDVLITSGDWTGLSRKYAIALADLDGAEAPSPEMLSKWWDAFGDSELTDLIRRALARNRSLAAARARVTEARAALGVSKSTVLPQIDSANSWTNSDTSDNSVNRGASSNLFHIGADLSWELDLFGGRRAEIDAAAASLISTNADLHSAWVSLAAEVAYSYVSLCSLNERLRIATESAATQTSTLEMVQSRYDSGLTDALALNQAKYQLGQTRASIPPIRSAIEAAQNAIAILVGEVPGSLQPELRTPRPIPTAGSLDLIGIPAEGLRRRPDIYAAEMRIIAQRARTRAARADLYPRFQLAGSIGLESLSSGNLLSGSSYGFSFGPRIVWPIFHGGAIRRNINIQSAREEQLVAAYEETVLTAVSEVRNALTKHSQDISRSKALADAAVSAQLSLDLAKDKFKNGLADFSNVLSAQAALLALEDQRAAAQGDIASDVISLFKALGGGWEPLDAELSAASTKR